MATWLKVLRDDKRAIVTAAGAATRALTFLHEKAGTMPQVADTEAA